MARRWLFSTMAVLSLTAASGCGQSQSTAPPNPAPNGASSESSLFTYNLDQLVNDLEKSGATTMEQALAALPENLRSSFTLQYESHGAQAADEKRPRALLFTNDGKFALTFNGDESQAQGDSWEVLQFVDGTVKPSGDSIPVVTPANESRFELYSIPFPLARAGGKIARPAKNPALCVTCHGQDPKPLWLRYDDWEGFFSEYPVQKDQTQPADSHFPAFQAFMQTRESHPRYRQLLPPKGSEYSPYLSNAALANIGKGVPYFQFLPNYRLTIGYELLIGRKIEDRLRQSAYYQALLPLLAFTLNIDAVGSAPYQVTNMGNPTCGHPRTASAAWSWTADDVQKTEDVVKSILLKEYGGVLPYPGDPVLSDRNIIALFGVRFGDLFTISKAGDPEPDPANDPDPQGMGKGNFLSPDRVHPAWIMSVDHYTDLVNAYPELLSEVSVLNNTVDSFLREVLFDPSALSSDYDEPLVRSWDAFGVSGTIDPQSDCQALYDLLRKRLLLAY